MNIWFKAWIYLIWFTSSITLFHLGYDEAGGLLFLFGIVLGVIFDR